NDSDAGVTASYSATADTFNIVAKDSGAKGFVKDPASFITDKTGTLGAALFGKYTTDATNNQSFTAGQDAIIKVSLDGGKTETELTRSTNKFSFDGLNIVLKGKNPDDSKPENIKFKVETHDEEIVTKIKEFISDYNKVIKNANDKIIDRKTKEDREFGPLTDEQKKEMSEDEVKAYEKRAKVGILQNDPHLSKMIQSFRTAMSDAVDEKALWKIGISTSADDWQSNGNLVIDEKKLETALAKDPQGVAELFTKTVEPDLSQALTPQQKKDAEKKAAMAGGISGRISFMVNASCGTSGGDGLLVSIAGKKGSPNNSDRLSNQLKQIDTTLANLKKTLQKEETRYFKQFTN
ncbi:MAG: flagellar filament capping protein FliD, partial [Oscillospiraceae bacterium]